MENNKKKIYQSSEILDGGLLKVDETHNINYEVSGNKIGKPVILLHGGPGGRISRERNGFFDPSYYLIVQFDQRGCGKSTPNGSLIDNTTWDLVSDIEKLRMHLKIEKWYIVVGGSWGSALALAYVQTHPKITENLLVASIFLVTAKELNFQINQNWIFPEYHDELSKLVPEVEREDITSAYWRRLNYGDEKTQIEFSKAWLKYENSVSEFIPSKEPLAMYEDDKSILTRVRIEFHYFINRGFMKKENQLLEDCELIKHIPTWIVHGRYDVVCPLKSAYDISKKFDKCEFIIIPTDGHYGRDLVLEIVSITDKLKI